MIRGMRTSEDLRIRVLRFVSAGGSKAEAARRFSVGVASVHRWVRLGMGWKPRNPGRPVGQGDKLDRSALKAALAKQPDLMLKELAHMFGVSINAVYHACETQKLSRKKNRDVPGSKVLRQRKKTISQRPV